MSKPNLLMTSLIILVVTVELFITTTRRPGI